jgi:prepilin-type N-terminal cleavage/methylation domain-containing protein
MKHLFRYKRKYQTNKGFTLIELLVVIAILLVVGTIVVASFTNFQTHQTLELTAKEVRQMFETARSETLASKNDLQYGVYVDTDEIVLFQGNSYVDGAPENVLFELDPRVVVSLISLSPTTDEILFSRGTGEPSSSGYIEVSLLNNPSAKRVITITSTGIIHSNE